ncbi:hypothetical protein ACGFZK_10110 [Streptomyces sp. NPDC048257]|uniref:hypothetical protein n=1 Tax=Streptomyces sp. NPDC048257 TaxID=3365526 RepID=UPI0037187BF8
MAGYDRLEHQVAGSRQIRAAALLLGQAGRLLSTVLQGFYPSHQASAAAVQVDNLHLIRGMLGRPGCGDLPGFRTPARGRARSPGPCFRHGALLRDRADADGSYCGRRGAPRGAPTAGIPAPVSVREPA